MRFGSLLFTAAAILYFSSKVFAGEATLAPADVATSPNAPETATATEIQYLPTPLNPTLTPYGAKAADHLAASLGISLTVEEKEGLAHAEKMAIRSTATASIVSSSAQATLLPTYLYCLKGGIAVGFSFDGATCVDGSGNKKSVGIIGLGGLEVQGHATVIVIYGTPGESINGLYSDANGTSLGIVLGGSGLKFNKKRSLESLERKAGYANLYSFGLGLGISRFSGAHMTIGDPE